MSLTEDLYDLAATLPSPPRRGRPRLAGMRYPSGDLKPIIIRRRPLPKPPVLKEEVPEIRYALTRRMALDLIGPLTLGWSVYARAEAGEVAGDPKRLAAARLLRDLGMATLAQRRGEAGMEYLIRCKGMSRSALS